MIAPHVSFGLGSSYLYQRTLQVRQSRIRKLEACIPTVRFTTLETQLCETRRLGPGRAHPPFRTLALQHLPQSRFQRLPTSGSSPSSNAKRSETSTSPYERGEIRAGVQSIRDDLLKDPSFRMIRALSILVSPNGYTSYHTASSQLPSKGWDVENSSDQFHATASVFLVDLSPMLLVWRLRVQGSHRCVP